MEEKKEDKEKFKRMKELICDEADKKAHQFIHEHKFRR